MRLSASAVARGLAVEHRPLGATELYPKLLKSAEVKRFAAAHGAPVENTARHIDEILLRG